MGYGALDRIPTLYGLRWNVPSLFLSAVRKSVGEPSPGWQHLWTHIVARRDVHVQAVRSVSWVTDWASIRRGSSGC